MKVEDPRDKVALVRGVYSDMLDRLKVNNKAMALNLFFGHAQPNYDDIFTKLGGDLAAATSQLGVIARVTVNSGSAEVVIMRDAAGVIKTFTVLMLYGEDGIWRIESM